jgi:hypothetical protein
MANIIVRNIEDSLKRRKVHSLVGLRGLYTVPYLNW